MNDFDDDYLCDCGYQGSPDAGGRCPSCGARMYSLEGMGKTSDLEPGLGPDVVRTGQPIDDDAPESLKDLKEAEADESGEDEDDY